MMHFFKNLKFQKKILFICLIVSFVPVITLGCFCYHQIKTILIEHERAALANSLVQEANSLHSQFGDYESTMEFIIWNKALNQALNSTYDNNFDMYVLYRDTIDPLFVTMKSLNTDIRDITIYADLDIYPHGTTLRLLH